MIHIWPTLIRCESFISMGVRVPAWMGGCEGEWARGDMGVWNLDEWVFGTQTHLCGDVCVIIWVWIDEPTGIQAQSSEIVLWNIKGKHCFQRFAATACNLIAHSRKTCTRPQIDLWLMPPFDCWLRHCHFIQQKKLVCSSCPNSTSIHTPLIRGC